MNCRQELDRQLHWLVVRDCAVSSSDLRRLRVGSQLARSREAIANQFGAQQKRLKSIWRWAVGRRRARYVPRYNWYRVTTKRGDRRHRDGGLRASDENIKPANRIAVTPTSWGQWLLNIEASGPQSVGSP